VTAYILRRLILLFPTLLLISVITFLLIRMIPGDAALLMALAGEEGVNDSTVLEPLRQKFGLDQPIHVQYANWVWGILRGDWGRSLWTNRDVLEEILGRFPVTVEIAVGTMVVSLLFAIPAGILSAIRQDSAGDYIGRVVNICGLAMPSFWIGTLLIIFPALWFSYLPSLGYKAPWENLGINLQQMGFAWLAGGFHSAARVMRMTRSQMLEVLRQDYIRTAWAKGLRERIVVLRHAIRNALITVVTLSGLQFGHLLGGTIVVETVFGLPGVGQFVLHAVVQRDYPQIQAALLFVAGVFVVVNLIVDVTYAWLDPRIRYS